MLLTPANAVHMFSMRCMLNICTAFAGVNNKRFNSAKSPCLRFRRQPSRVEQFPVELQSVALTWTDQILQLGHVLC